VKTISDILIPKLQERFVGRGMRVASPPSPCALFPAEHPDVGEIQIYDDGSEVTLVAGNFTHGHFSNYDDELSVDQKAEQISGEVVTFLDALFADRIVLWGSHKQGGGWCHLDHSSSAHGPEQKKYVWSGPLSKDAKLGD
jgi:hypothetical protein